MPDLDCLNKDMQSIKTALQVHTSQIDRLSSAMAENTIITKTIAENTSDIVDAMKWLNTTKRIILWLGGLAGGIWAIFEAFRNLKL
jgi:hypothetical protein